MFPPRIPCVLTRDSRALRHWLGQYLADANGSPVDQPERIRALVLPHIDYKRGRPTYRAAHRALRTMSKPDLVVMFGTSHEFHPAVLHGTRSSFEMPLGNVQTAVDVMTEIGRLTGGRIFEAEALHLEEWSIELPLLIVQHGLGPSNMPPILPFIASSVERRSLAAVLQDSYIETMLQALTYACKRLMQSGLTLLFVAGVDLSHVGVEFDEPPAVGRREDEVERRDLEYLSLLLQHRGADALELLIRTRNKTRIDAGAPMFFMLEVLRRIGLSLEGELLCYHQSARTEPKDCIVSHATAIFRE